MASSSFALPTNWETIKDKIWAYYHKYNAIAKIVAAHNLETGQRDVVIDTEQEYLQFYIDDKALKSLNEISELKGFKAIGVFFGLGDVKEKNRLTCCFVGIDEKGKVLPQHKGVTVVTNNGEDPNIGLPKKGEDQWPPPPFNFSGEISNSIVTLANDELKENMLKLSDSCKKVTDFLDK